MVYHVTIVFSVLTFLPQKSILCAYRRMVIESDKKLRTVSLGTDHVYMFVSDLCVLMTLCLRIATLIF